MGVCVCVFWGEGGGGGAVVKGFEVGKEGHPFKIFRCLMHHTSQLLLYILVNAEYYRLAVIVSPLLLAVEFFM